MYYVVVAAFMFVLPGLSIVVQSMGADTAFGPAIVCKWFVFWSVGWRLLLAGIRQILNPAYTAREILGLKSDESQILVRELGFANFAMGALGILSLFESPWQRGAALVGGIFYAFAGVNHMFQNNRNRLANVAMYSDIFAAAVLLGTLAVMATHK